VKREEVELLVESGSADSSGSDINAKDIHLRLLHSVAAEFIPHDGEHFVAERI
jgi:hypothetical protein